MRFFKYIAAFVLVFLTFVPFSHAEENTMPSVQQELDALKQKFSANADEEKKSDYEKGIALVRESGAVDSAKQVGDKAPDFTLPDALGGDVTLSELLKEGPVVLVWYRGGWCPYCNIHLHALQQALPEFNKAGAELVAISPELPDNSISTKDKNNLAFHVLSDVQNKVGKVYNVVYTLPDFIAARYNKTFDLMKYNGDDSNELPLSAAYVIAQDGTITFAFLDADYRNRAEPADLLKAVQTLK